MSDSLEQSVRRTLADVLGLAPETIPADASSETLEQWESIAHMNLILALEAEHGVSFDPDEIAEVASLPALVASLRAKGA